MQKAIELVCDKLTLRGMIHIPGNGKGKYPFVAMYHGFTGNKMESEFMFVTLSRALEKAGIGSVRFDFSGSGESDGQFGEMTVSRELREAGCIYEFMSSMECADQNRLFILGMSMGGLVAGLLAPQIERLKGLVLWAPAGSMPQYAERLMQDRKAFMDEAGNMDLDGLLLGADYFKDVKNIDSYGRATGYRGDVLIVHGTGDESVPIEDTYRYREVYGERAQVVEIADANHTFQRIEWKNKLIDATVAFIVKHA